MAVNLVAPQNHGYELVEMCGVDKDLMAKAKALGIQVTHSPTGTLAIKGADGLKSYGIVPFKGQAISLLKEGKLGPASKESVKYQVEKSLKVAIEEHGSMPEPAVEVEEQSLVAPTPKKKATKAKADTFNPFTAKKQGGSMSQVKLVDATDLYQPVFGTSNGSVYHVAAMFDELKLAVRKTGGSLSVRVEGAVSKYAQKLESVGFSVKGDYASVHLEVKDDELYAKTFGAIIGALGFEKLSAVGNPFEAK